MSIWRSLRLRVLAATTLSLLFATIVVLILIARSFEDSLQTSFDRSLQGYLNQVAAVVTDEQAEQKLERQLGSGEFGRPYSGLYWQIENDSGVVLRSRSLWDAKLSLPSDDVNFTAVHTHQLRGPGGQTVRVLERRVVASDGSEWTIAVASDRIVLDREIAGFQGQLYGFARLLLFLTLLAAVVQYFVIQRPIAALGKAIAALDASEQNRLVGNFPSELDTLIDHLNQLIERNEQIAANARHQATSLAHSIKTPVAIIRNEIDVLRSGQPERANWPALTASVARIDRMSHFYLMRAKGRTVVGARSRPIRVRPLVFEIVQAVRRLHAERPLTIDYDCPDDVQFFGEPTDLEEMLGNLIDNAAKWATRRVVCVCKTKGDVLTVVVEDDGPGIPAEQRQDMLQPGTRLDSDMPGTGFGLAIVAELVDAHGGGIEIGDASPHGLRVTIRFPGHANRD